MSSKNSTTVRFMRGAARVALQRAPGLVGAAVWWRFTLAPTARMPVRPEQQEVLDGARRWSFRADGLEL
ncbi:MAG: hypothetical protein KC656_34070, partial [Myxococcales bacterium]|nr:hypothetical protein [Myxococcales bacterium]